MFFASFSSLHIFCCFPRKYFNANMGFLFHLCITQKCIFLKNTIKTYFCGFPVTNCHMEHIQLKLI